MQRTRHLHRRSLAVLSAVALIFSLLPATVASADEHDDLLFTQYIEGSSNNKAIEVGNLTGSAVDLDDGGYYFVGYHNGSQSPTYQFELTGDLADGEAWILAHSSADAALTSVADVTTGTGLWNGDDALVLYRDYDPGADSGQVLDSIGQIGEQEDWAKDTTLCPVEGRVSGDTDPSDAYDASDDWESFPQDTFEGIGDPFACGSEGGPDEPAVCDAVEDDITRIHKIQGAGSTSDYAGDPVYSPGDPVTIKAVVTLAEPGLDGFFVQEAPENEDNDPATSEGLFIEGSAPGGAQAGDTVEVTGGVLENFGRTQLRPFEEIAVCDDGPVEIEPTELPLPSAPAEREPYENMLVTASDLVVSGNYSAYTHGELITGFQGELPTATEVAAPGEGAEDVVDEVKAREVILDDRSTSSIYGRSIWDEDPERRLGDEIDEVTGVLDYTFGNYKIQYTEFPEFELYGAPEVPQLTAGNDIGAFNVLNYFNEFGDSDRLRGARSQAQFDLQSEKIVNTILELDPTVLGLIELQNDYLDEFDEDPDTEPSIATLVDKLNEEAGEARYEYVRIPEDELLVDETALNGGGAGPDAIANGIIYQPDRAMQVGEATTFDIDSELEGDDRKNRWPVAATFEIDGELATIAVNHFKSKGSSCEDVIGPDFDAGDDDGSDLTGSCDLTRQYAAEQLVEWMGGTPTGVETDNVFLVGDFNSYAQEAPIQILKDAGYVNTVEQYGDGAFTYKFSGRVGTLDYIFAAEEAVELVHDAEVWQINSRASQTDLYYIADDTTDGGTKGSSDHDPLVVSLLPSFDPVRDLLEQAVDDGDVRVQIARNVERAVDRAEGFLADGRLQPALSQLKAATKVLEGQGNASGRAARGPVAQQDPDVLAELVDELQALIDGLS